MNTIKRIAASCLVAVVFLSARGDEVDVGDGANDNTYTDATAYAGATKIVKTGTGKTTINFGTYATQPNFTGEIEVREGTLAVHGIQNLGSPTKITVIDGATLDLTTQQSDAPTNLQGTEIAIAGAGVDSAGALVRGGVKGINNLFRTLTLNDDATITLTIQMGLGDGSSKYGIINLDGKTLTLSGSARFYLPNVRILGADGTGANPGNIIDDGALFFANRYTTENCGTSANKITIKDGKSLVLRSTAPLAWTIEAEGKATILGDNSTVEETRDVIIGPATFAGGTVLRALGSTAPANARLAFSGGDLAFSDSVSIEGKGKVTMKDDKVTVASGKDVTIQGDVSAVFTNSTMTFGHALSMKSTGTATFSGTTAEFLTAARITVTNPSTATLNIERSEIKGHLNDSGQGQTRFYIGSGAGMRGAVAISGSETVVTNFSLNIGEAGCGALYQRGGASSWTVGAAAYDRIGFQQDSYGYIGVTGGRLALETSTAAGMHVAYSGTVVVASRGGTIEFRNKAPTFAYKSGSKFIYWQDNGATNTFAATFDLGVNGDRSQSGSAELTISGAGSRLSVAGDYGMRFLWSVSGASAMLNLRDGATLATKFLYRVSAAGKWYVNLDGGTIMPLRSDANIFNSSDYSARVPTLAAVYEGGFAIDTSESRDASYDLSTALMHMSFAAPGDGKRIAAIAIPDGLAFESVMGPPVVTITGDGEGASAYALFDDTSRTITNIVVASPGWGYTTATATLSSGGLSTAYECTVTLEDQPASGWKGFTKRGGPRLNMYGVNTFRGDVTVEDGILGFMKEDASQGGMPEGAGVTLAEGSILTFPAASTPVTVPFLAGCGATSYGDFTVTNRIECAADDIFAGKSLTIGQNLTLADGVKIVVTDPENLAKYRDSKPAAVVACGKTITANGTVSLAFADGSDEKEELWCLAVKEREITLGYLNGTMIIFR